MSDASMSAPAAGTLPSAWDSPEPLAAGDHVRHRESLRVGRVQTSWDFSQGERVCVEVEGETRAWWRSDVGKCQSPDLPASASITTPPVEQRPGGRFQPGDRVRTLAGGSLRGKEGLVNRCDRDDDDNAMFAVGIEDQLYWFSAHEIELVPPEPPAPDARREQVGGDHYTRLEIQPWDVIEATAPPEGVYWYFVGNAIKYLMRAQSKGGLQDLHKARHYLDRLIALVEQGKAACGKVVQPEGEQ